MRCWTLNRNREEQIGVPRAPRAWRGGLLVAAIIVAAVVTAKYTRHYVLAKRFAVVEPGALYRCGRLKPWPLERVTRDYEIKTILTLLDDVPADRDQAYEKQLAKERGITLIRVPMPGDGRGSLPALDRAADILADQERRPLLFHCAAGVHRAGATLAAYRMKHCGWSFEEAIVEGRSYGYPIDHKPELVAHLRAYESRYITGDRSAGSAAARPATQPTEAAN